MSVARIALAAVVATVVDAVYGFVVYGNVMTSEFGRYPNVYRVERNLYKNVVGTALVFEEINHDLQLSYRYAWRTTKINTAAITQLYLLDKNFYLISGTYLFTNCLYNTSSPAIT